LGKEKSKNLRLSKSLGGGEKLQCKGRSCAWGIHTSKKGETWRKAEGKRRGGKVKKKIMDATSGGMKLKTERLLTHDRKYEHAGKTMSGKRKHQGRMNRLR